MRLFTALATLLNSSLLLCCALAHGADHGPLNTTTQSALPGLSTNSALNNTSDVVPADIAFTLNAFAESNGDITLVWEFPPRYYLYRKSLTAQKADGTALALQLPEGEKISDEFFGESEVYFERLVASLPASTLNAAPGSSVELQLAYQGCVRDTICYPAQFKTVTVTLPD
jgi:thiol:disulfide interchange protein DsbD